MIPAGAGKIAAITGAASGSRQAACWRLLALPLPRRAANADNPSRVVLLSSIAALRPKIVGGAYAASGVLVNALAPGSP